MKRVLIFLAATFMVASAYGQTYEFRYDGFADVIFSCPERGSGGRAFVHDANNVLTINYEGDFTNGVKIGNSFWIANNGNTGVGIKNPQEKLAVNGNIRAREVKVETSNWPDYVFKSDYRLASLVETENFIKENGHLPDVPKAADVEMHGVQLGEMNKLLLKKMEEMTLHMIQLNKTVEKQSEQITIQANQIKSLQKKDRKRREK